MTARKPRTARPRKYKPGTAAYAKRMADLGLVTPLPDRPNKALAKVQKQYYAKLAKAGFKDLEWVDHTSGRGQNSDYLKQPSGLPRMWRPERLQFYRLVSAYAVHGTFASKRDKAAMTMLADGKSFRAILSHLRQRHGYRRSLYSLFYELQELLKQCHIFNLTHREGLLNPANTDAYGTDALISDPQMTQCYMGLPVDDATYDLMARAGRTKRPSDN